MGVVVSIDEDRKKGSPLEALTALVAEDLSAVNALIVRRMESPVPLIPDIAGHIVAAGGKRLRPVLTLAAARMCGYRGTRQVALATCVEFIHTATLLHDDVVDGSELRRGLASANTLWGNQASVLVGDFLFSRAFQLMVEDGSLAVLEILSRTASVIAEGEVMQLATTNDVETGETTYLEVIRAKTAQLFAAACRIGAVVAERPAVEESALEAYGLNLGIAYQLIDDVLDYAAMQATLGKTVGEDFADGNITLPVILAFRRGGRIRARLLAQDVAGPGPERRRFRRGHPPNGEARRACRFGRARPPLRGDRPRHHGHLRRRAGKAGPGRAHRFLHRARLLIHLPGKRAGVITPPSVGTECSSAW